MRDIRNVLAATDFSPWSEVAMRAAATAADLYKAKMIAAHVLQNLDETYALLVEDVDALKKQEHQEAERNMDALLDDLRISHSRTRSVVTRGSAVDGLIRLALQEHADLVVAGMIGSTSRSPQGHLGSVVERLLMCGLFDLLLVHHDLPETISRVAAATDFSKLADTAVQRAADIASRVGVDKVTVIHAYEWPQGYSKLGLSEEENERHCLASATAQFVEFEQRVPPPEGMTYEPAFVRGPADEAIHQACEEHEIELLTIGAAGRTAAAVALIGNVAMKIARHAPCSTWVTRPAGHKLTFVDAIQRMMGLED